MLIVVDWIGRCWCGCCVVVELMCWFVWIGWCGIIVVG